MPNTVLSNLGEITSNFLMDDFDVYIQNTSATGSYASTDWALLGHTLPEKTINRVKDDFVRKAKIPHVEIFRKTLEKGLELSFSLQNVEMDMLGVINQGSTVDLGSTGTEVRTGTNEPVKEYRAVRFVSTREDKQFYSITIPKCNLVPDGEQSTGGDENTVIPIRAIATFNPNETNTKKNLYYENLWASNISATADVPSGWN